MPPDPGPRGHDPGRPAPGFQDADAPLPRPPDPNRICGAAPVRALFLRRPQAVLRLFFTPERAEFARPLANYMTRQRRPWRAVPPLEMARIAGTTHHGGVVAAAQARFAEPLPGHALPADFVTEAAKTRLVVVLDGIGNPHNLGAIARSAAFFGCRALLLSDDPRQADLSDAAFRIAEGGLEHLRVLRARNLPVLLRGMRGGFLTLALGTGGVPPDRVPRDRPIALVLGDEAEGLPAPTRDACEMTVSLPGSGLVDSLNTAAAAAVLIHALGGSAPGAMR